MAGAQILRKAGRIMEWREYKGTPSGCCLCLDLAGDITGDALGVLVGYFKPKRARIYWWPFESTTPRVLALYLMAEILEGE